MGTKNIDKVNFYYSQTIKLHKKITPEQRVS